MGILVRSSREDAAALPSLQVQRSFCPDDTGVRAQVEKQVQAIDSAQKDNLANACQVLVSAGVSKDPNAREEICEYPLTQPPILLAGDHSHAQEPPDD